MSDPWLRSPSVSPFIANWPNGPNQSTDNVTALAAGAANGMGVLNAEQLGIQSTPWGDIIIPVWKLTLASSPTTGGLISRYLLFSEDDILWPGAINPSVGQGTNQAAALAAWLLSDPQAANLALLDQLTVQSGQTVYQTRWYSVRGLIGTVPRFLSILLANGASVAFSATAGNHNTGYAVEYYA
jgi:hypothetical protein